MITDEHIAGYIDSLERNLPKHLGELERQALADNVPIIRKPAQSLLRFLINDRKPKRILEVGTAVGFSASLMAEYMPEGATLTTIEKVPMRIAPAKENLRRSDRKSDITLLIGDANDVLKALNGNGGFVTEVYLPGEDRLIASPDIEKYKGTYDFIFMDAAKGQYMNFYPEIIKLLSDDGIFITDNVLQEGSIASSKFSVTRRDRTIHMRMRQYLYTLTHDERIDTVVLPVGDGMTLSIRTKQI